MNEGDNWQAVLEGIRSNDRASVKQLYKDLYSNCYPELRKASSDEKLAVETFQDA